MADDYIYGRNFGGVDEPSGDDENLDGVVNEDYTGSSGPPVFEDEYVVPTTSAEETGGE